MNSEDQFVVRLRGGNLDRVDLLLDELAVLGDVPADPRGLGAPTESPGQRSGATRSSGFRIGASIHYIIKVDSESTR